MRHRKNKNRLGRNTAHRKATLRNMVRGLIKSQKIKTTRVKAKEAKILMDKLITIAKKNTPAHQRLAFSMLPDKETVKTLFREVAPRFEKRAGGYTRVIPLTFRRGDGANMVILELTEKKIVEEVPVKPAKERTKQKAKEVPAKKKAQSKQEEKPVEQKVAPKPKAAVAEEIAKEKGKAEKKKIEKGFMKGLRRFFKSKTP